MRTKGWTLAFDLADPRRAGAYQGVSQTGPAIGGMLAPAIVTATAIEHGAVGWSVLSALFLAAGLATHALARRAGVVQRTSEPALSVHIGPREQVAIARRATRARRVNDGTVAVE